MPIGELDLEVSVGHSFHNGSFEFDYIIFSQKNPSILCMIRP